MKKIESLPPHNFLLLFSLLKKNKTKFTSLEVKTHILQKNVLHPHHTYVCIDTAWGFSFEKRSSYVFFKFKLNIFFITWRSVFGVSWSVFLRVLPNLGQYYVLLLRLCLHQIHIFQSIHMNTFHNTTKSITTWRFFFGKKHPHTMMIFFVYFSICSLFHYV